MHYQREPHSEVKLVRCLKGSIWDVIIDIRPNSPTYRRTAGGKVSISRTQMDASSTFRRDLLTASRPSATASRSTTSACGIRYDDMSFSITWPLAITEISANDLSWPDFDVKRNRCGRLL